jgi:integrase
MNRTLHELEKMNPVFKTLWEFSLKTVIRLDELMSLLWVNVNFEKSVAFISLTKNGDIRYITSLMKDIYIFKLLPRDIEGRVFPLNKSSISVLFLRAARRAKVVEIHLHNLWYMALTSISSIFKNI